MSPMLTTIEERQTWGRFESVRERLFDQFKTVTPDPETGLSVADLGREIDAHLQRFPDRPRVLQKAHALRIVLTMGRIAIDPIDWFASHLGHGGLVRKLRDSWLSEVEAGPLKEEAIWRERMYELGILRGGIDVNHIEPGWENMLSEGLTGLIEQARTVRDRLGGEASTEQVAFLEAVEIVYQAAIALSERFADLATRMAPEHPEHEERLRAVADACVHVPARRPRTFHEALQFLWFMQNVIEIEGEAPMSLGHFDRMLFPWYRSDIEDGRLTRDQARELLTFFWYKYHARTRGKGDSARNFTMAGQTRDGDDATNDLTRLALEAFEEIDAPDPKLSVRFFPGTPEWLFERVAELIRGGHNTMVLFNDTPAVEALVGRGKTLEDARSYVSIGCYEPAVDGMEAACTMNLPVNLAKALELALHDGVDPLSGERIGPETGDPGAFETFEDVFDAYTAQLEYLLTRAASGINAYERQWPRINPSPAIAGSILDCLDRAKDIGEGGARYNSVGAIGIALANTCDSLIALRHAVFEERRFDMRHVLTAIDSDFDGEEPMRQYLLNRPPKWGAQNPEADAMARRVADHFCDKVHTLTSARGGVFQAALFSLRFQWFFAKQTGALPDGRKARTPLAPGVGAAPGRDRAGVTALMNSVATLDFTRTPDGSVLDIMLHPSAVSGREGVEAIGSLIKAFFARGGYALQFNVVDADTLRDAQQRPDRHASLQIRVTGYSAYFTQLSKYEQDLFIARNTHLV